MDKFKANSGNSSLDVFINWRSKKNMPILLLLEISILRQEISNRMKVFRKWILLILLILQQLMANKMQIRELLFILTINIPTQIRD